MKVRSKPYDAEAAQIIPGDFDDPHPNDHHVPGVIYDPRERCCFIDPDDGPRMRGKMGDWIIRSDSGTFFLTPAQFESNFGVVDDDIGPDFVVEGGHKYLGAMMSFLDRETGNVKQAICYPIIGVVLMQRQGPTNPQGLPWRDFQPSEDGSKWVEKGIEDLPAGEPEVEALREVVRQYQGDSASLTALKMKKRAVEAAIAEVVGDHRASQVRGEMKEQAEMPSWPRLVAAKKDFDQAISMMLV